MSCPRALRLLQPLIDRSLSEPAAEDLQTHLDSCPSCRTELARLRRIHQTLADEPTIDPPSGLAPAIARRAAAQHLTAKRILLPAWLEALTLGGAAVALGAAGFVGVSILSTAFGLRGTSLHLGADCISLEEGFGPAFATFEATPLAVRRLMVRRAWRCLYPRHDWRHIGGELGAVLAARGYAPEGSRRDDP